MSLVRLENVRKSFGGAPVLSGVNLRIESGEKIGLIGRNGTGKTTLFRLITGEIEPDGGVIERRRRTRIAHLTQMRGAASSEDNRCSETIFDAALACFADLIALEEELNCVEQRITALAEAGDPSLDAMSQHYGALQEAFAAQGGYEFRANVKRVLHGLGFDVAEFNLPMYALSGGQRTRLMLALVLLQDADLLLLDEPENHLDIAAQEWLEAFLLECPKAVMVVSHDRRMLSTVVDRIVEVERRQLAAYSGNYEYYYRQKRLLREQQRKAYEQQQEFLDKEERWIERFRYKSSKASQVQSRIKRLEKLERVEAPLPERSPAKFDFGEVVRSGQWVVDAAALSMGYGSLELYRDLNLQVTRGERVGIVGPNGSGKTTLLRHLAGRLSDEPNAKGVVTLGHNVAIGLYEQQHETLRRSMNLSNDILTEIRNLRPDLTPERVRSFMGRFLFTGDDIFKPLAALSGGELSRVAIAKLILAGANLLLLDEPTNHLDIASREVIEDALMDFGGTILLVSHDRQLIDRLANRLIVMEHGEATVHWGNYSHYRWKRDASGGPPSEASASASRKPSLRSEVLKIRRDKHRRDKARSRAVENEVRKKRRLVEELEGRIELVEQMVEALETQFCQVDPADHERTRTLKAEYDGLKADLRALYEEWEGLVSEQADRQ